MMSAYIAKAPRWTGKIVRIIFLQIHLYQRRSATVSALGQNADMCIAHSDGSACGQLKQARAQKILRQ